MNERNKLKQAGMVGLLCFTIFLALYGYTVSPTVGMGHDTGELTTCCITQGVPHSPGYPLFVAIGWLAAQLPIGADPAYRINLLGAAEIALGLGILGAALALRTRPLSALVGVLLIGTCSAVWRQAAATEVFSLHLLFLSTLLALALLWEEASDVRRREILLVTSFILGCCLAHQHIIALAAPPFLIFGFLAKGKGRAWGFQWLCLPIFLATVSLPYWLQAYEASLKPALNWNDPENWQSMRDHFLRRSYGTGVLNEAATLFDSRAGAGQASAYFISLLRSYFPFPSFLLILLALDRAITTRAPHAFWLYLGIFLAYGPGFALLGNQPGLEFYGDMMERFYSSSILGLGGLAALGLDWLASQTPADKRKYLAACLLLPLFNCVLNYPKASQRNQFQALELLQAVYQSLPPRSVLVTNGDLPAGSANYVRLVLGQNRHIISIMPGLAGAEWYQETLPARLQLAGQLQEGEELKHETSLIKMVDVLIAHGYTVWSNLPPKELPGTFVQCGLVHRYFPPNSALWNEAEYRAALKRSYEVMRQFPKRGSYRLDWRQPFWFRFCVDQWIDGYYSLAQNLLQTEPEWALYCLDRVVEMEDPVHTETYITRAKLLLTLGRPDQAARDYKSAWERARGSRTILNGLIHSLELAHRDDEANRYRLELQRLQQE